jgi:hypothetical protein
MRLVSAAIGASFPFFFEYLTVSFPSSTGNGTAHKILKQNKKKGFFWEGKQHVSGDIFC